MTASFYLWHCQRQGYITANGTTSTDWKQAALFNAAEALQRCRAAIDHEGVCQVLPIRVNDLAAVFA